LRFEERVTAPEVIRREVLLPAAPPEVWQALTDGPSASEWFGAEVEMATTLGGRVRFRWPDGGERAAVVEAVEVERLLVLRWLPFERDAGGRTTTRPSTRVRFTLTTRDEGTLLVVEETLPASDQEGALPSARFGFVDIGSIQSVVQAGPGR
jgi:uncharacterized protein YndB with AHSA1/START domain